MMAVCVAHQGRPILVKRLSMDRDLLQQLMTRFDTPGVNALVLMGSHARGTQQRSSDVDLARFTNAHGHGHTGRCTAILTW